VLSIYNFECNPGIHPLIACEPDGRETASAEFVNHLVAISIETIPKMDGVKATCFVSFNVLRVTDSLREEKARVIIVVIAQVGGHDWRIFKVALGRRSLRGCDE
jgi:hypothetical protein